MTVESLGWKRFLWVPGKLGDVVLALLLTLIGAIAPFALFVLLLLAFPEPFLHNTDDPGMDGTGRQVLFGTAAGVSLLLVLLAPLLSFLKSHGWGFALGGASVGLFATVFGYLVVTGMS